MGMKRGWFRRPPSDDEMREELEAHVAMRAEHDRVDEAAARRRLGNMLHTRESMRRVWIAEWWDALRQDAHFTWRSWRRRPGFALGAIFVLALGLGASTALFAALDRVLFRPLPFADPDRLVSVGLLSAPPNRGFEDQTESVPDQGYVRTWSTTPAPFESVTAMNTFTCEISEAQPEGIRCGRVEHNLLRVLGVHVAAGRDFSPDDDLRGTPRVALISHALWVRRYGSNPRVVERTLSLETPMGLWSPVRIVGVLPEDFEMPLEAADILIPAQLRPLDPKAPFASRIVALGRLMPERDAGARGTHARTPAQGNVRGHPLVVPCRVACAATARSPSRRRRTHRVAAHGRCGHITARRGCKRHQPPAGASRRTPARVCAPRRHRRGQDATRSSGAQRERAAVARGGRCGTPGRVRSAQDVCSDGAARHSWHRERRDRRSCLRRGSPARPPHRSVDRCMAGDLHLSRR